MTTPPSPPPAANMASPASESPDEAGPDVGRSSWLRWGLPGLLLACGVAVAVGLWALRPPPKKLEPRAEIPLVETIVLERPAAEFLIHTQGIVVPKHEITLAAEVRGRVTRKSDRLRAGAFVAKGTFLLEIDPRLYKLEESRLTAELEQADIDLRQLDVEEANSRALLRISETELELAKREFARAEALSRQQGVLTQSDRDQAQLQVARAQASLQTLQNALELIPSRRQRLAAQKELTAVRLQQAQLDAEKARIVAPIDGVISAEGVEENDFVQPGTMLLKLEDPSVVEVKCQLRVDDLYWLWLAQRPSATPPSPEPPTSDEATISDERSEGDLGSAARAIFTSSVRAGERAGPTARHPLHDAPRTPAEVECVISGQTFTWQGFLSRYEGAGVDERTRTIACRVEVPNPVREAAQGLPTLVRGMFVQVRLKSRPDVPLYRIPATAYRPGGKVWALGEEVETSPSDGLDRHDNHSGRLAAAGPSGADRPLPRRSTPGEAVAAETGWSNGPRTRSVAATSNTATSNTGTSDAATSDGGSPGSSVYEARAAAIDDDALRRLEVHAIEVARWAGDDVWLRVEGSSLLPGQRIIVSPLAAAIEGMPVRPIR